MAALSTVYRDKNLQIVFGITLMVVLGVSSIIPIIPEVADKFKVSKSAIGLLLTVFTLPGIFLAPVAGILADRYGRKTVLVPSLLIFGLFGTLCGFATSFEILLVLRFLQGTGAGALGVLALTIIGDIYSGKERAAAMGVNAAVLSVGTAVYPAVGGGLALLGWNYPFFLPVLAFPLALLVVLKMDSPEPARTLSFRRYMGAALRQIAAFQVLLILTATLITFILLYGPYITYFPILLDGEHLAEPFHIGIIISSGSLFTAVTAFRLGGLVKIFSERKLIAFSFVLYALSFALIPVMPSKWLLVLPAAVFGIAQGLNIPNLSALLAGHASLENRASLMAVNGMLLRLGQTIGPLAMGLVYGALGIHWVFFTAVLLAFIMILIALLLK